MDKKTVTIESKNIVDFDISTTAQIEKLKAQLDED